jgi:AhpD family alkylhydroperoxidase
MLDEKTKELIAIGAATTANCQACLEHHTARAQREGARKPEILAAIDVGREVRRGAAGEMDRFAAELTGAAPVEKAGCGCA